MFTCLEDWKHNLVELTENEFLAFLDHSETCQYHAGILKQYESEMLLLVKEAYLHIPVEPVVIAPVFSLQNVWNKVSVNTSWLRNYILSFNEPEKCYSSEKIDSDKFGELNIQSFNVFFRLNLFSSKLKYLAILKYGLALIFIIVVIQNHFIETNHAQNNNFELQRNSPQTIQQLARVHPGYAEHPYIPYIPNKPN